jgi:hypothetical protein
MSLTGDPEVSYAVPDDGLLKFGWQRDWLDHASTAHTFVALASSGKAPRPLLDRMKLRGMEQPGHYSLSDLPSTVWPPPVEGSS